MMISAHSAAGWHNSLPKVSRGNLTNEQVVGNTKVCVECSHHLSWPGAGLHLEVSLFERWAYSKHLYT